jgi:hypothetical protein
MTERKIDMNMIDEYIVLKGEIDKAKEELEILADKIKSQGAGTYEGKLGKVAVTRVAGRKLTKWELVCAAAKVPQKIVDQYTTVGEQTLRITIKP